MSRLRSSRTSRRPKNHRLPRAPEEGASAQATTWRTPLPPMPRRPLQRSGPRVPGQARPPTAPARPQLCLMPRWQMPRPRNQPPGRNALPRQKGRGRPLDPRSHPRPQPHLCRLISPTMTRLSASSRPTWSGTTAKSRNPRPRSLQPVPKGGPGRRRPSGNQATRPEMAKASLAPYRIQHRRSRARQKLKHSTRRCKPRLRTSRKRSPKRPAPPSLPRPR